jgi:hypothetical protein
LRRRITLGLAARNLERLAVDEDTFVVGEFAITSPVGCWASASLPAPAARATPATPTISMVGFDSDIGASSFVEILQPDPRMDRTWIKSLRLS